MILGYEGNKAISIPGIIVGLIFIALAGYTWYFSYLQKTEKDYLFKLPYRNQVHAKKVFLLKKWHNFEIYQVRSEFQNYSILVISRKKK
ncbi:MAG: hypothetical protein LKU_01060 [Lactobacillus kefiranofaciens]|uniref:Uncharacterized protein n=2 Tax=Lactobacillus kefiranofaciens TaxID=267818 RepID=A0AAX3UFH8_9LACO|nr:hypothetical protein [Lactobacillus kefiranofaciens]AEG40218.1 Hypothetical protein WANG_0523 [Lactobacillus kefiranofaciens subsp. kefiranofaciens]KRL25550.1 hypothetical protein FC94_GL001144 [Lactobacillus kefiranofaciens subsp. kefirgranum DSM 10550 = JCM 8572]KRM23044.1 hypothetical protein FC93_GL000024 [Lactobacillus kefiranofaciens subsp. kefiranofaciens DSM 5016 = JCM 6985]MCJ2171382.1 hypothetical protein [Lactobacillus kefiranofaciens]MDF4141911.1 hypothetical protein [Lactobacil